MASFHGNAWDSLGLPKGQWCFRRELLQPDFETSEDVSAGVFDMVCMWKPTLNFWDLVRILPKNRQSEQDSDLEANFRDDRIEKSVTPEHLTGACVTILYSQLGELAETLIPGQWGGSADSWVPRTHMVGDDQFPEVVF